MSGVTIKSSLIAIFTAIAIITAGFGWTSIASLSKLQQSTQRITAESMPGVLAAEEIRARMFELKIAYFAHITAATPAATASAEEAIAEAQKGIQAALDRYGNLTTGTHTEDALDAVSRGVAAYLKEGDGMLNLSKMGMYDGATKALGQMNNISDPIFIAIGELVKANTSDVAAAVSFTDQTHRSGERLVYLILAAVGTLIAAACLYAMRGIAGPIGSITRSITNLADGDTQAQIPFSNRTDEIGRMAHAVEIFRQAAIRNKNLEREAEESRTQAEAVRQRLAAEAEAEARVRMTHATSSLEEGIKRLASGDLSFSIEESFAPEFDGLRQDLNAAIDQLRETLSSVAEVADVVGEGSREVGTAADDLARRTEQQAASLEETAAALDQITLSIRNSSRLTQEARDIAALANASATQSRKVVETTTDAMGRIEKTSQQISNIIGVIDEIAFQTNLLALNAGVEAARAGAAGSGFAVVAQEVRELAQRSATAAKEIKDLIGGSKEEVATGVRLVSETGSALSDIGGYVIKINEYMSQIASTAHEQSSSLAEVNAAVNQMDQLTQQNAAMVEETSAASMHLAQESNDLRARLSHFTLAAEFDKEHATVATGPYDARLRVIGDR